MTNIWNQNTGEKSRYGKSRGTRFPEINCREQILMYNFHQIPKSKSNFSPLAFFYHQPIFFYVKLSAHK